LAAVLGDPVRHSLSPVLHNAAFAALDLDWAFVAFEVAAGDAAAAIAGVRALGLDGVSVTMPHKSAVAELLDELSPRARALGAVNTICRRGTTLVGENTDGAGFLDALQDDEGFDPAGRACAVLGAGGAARAVAQALGEAGASQVSVLARRREEADRAAALAGRVGSAADLSDSSVLRAADLLVNATPLGMRPDDPLPFDPALLHAGQLFVDLVYHPAVTPIVAAAHEAGIAAVNGLGMLIHQAGHAFRLWTGEEAPLGAMSAAAVAVLTHATPSTPLSRRSG
jgi:shikimate dehydrogenase